MSSAAGFARWQDLTSPELAAAAARDPVAILPLAAVEQHGPHLPLSTDLEINHGLLEAAAAVVNAKIPVLVLPALAVGTSMEHDAFPGTLSLDPVTAVEVIRQHGSAVARSGVRRLLLLNSHGGNAQVMDLAALRLRRDQRMLVVKCSYFRLPPLEDTGLPDVELQFGWHGGALETSMMLHLAPAVVREDLAGRAESLAQRMASGRGLLGPEGPASFAWMSGDLNPSGVVGDGRLANAALGARLVAHYATQIAQVLRETHAFPLDVLAFGRPSSSDG